MSGTEFLTPGKTTILTFIAELRKHKRNKWLPLAPSWRKFIRARCTLSRTLWAELEGHVVTDGVYVVAGHTDSVSRSGIWVKLVLVKEELLVQYSVSEELSAFSKE